MRAILAFELRLLRGGTSVLLFTLGVVGVLALAHLLGRVMPFAAEAIVWIAAPMLLILLWRERTSQRQLDALVGSLPLGPADLSAGHLLFWAGASLFPAVALALLAHGDRGAGPSGLLALQAWVWLLTGICVAGWFTEERSPRRLDARRGLLVSIVVLLMAAWLPMFLLGSGPVVFILLVAVLVVQSVALIGSRGSIEFLPTLTPKRVRAGSGTRLKRGRAVPLRRRRDREGVRTARARNARSPRATLIYLLSPFWLVPFFGLYVSGAIGLQAQRAGTTAGVGLVVLLALLHIHLHLALPRWQFLRQTPIPGRRIVLWLGLPLLLALLPSACVLRTGAEATAAEADFVQQVVTSRFQQIDIHRDPTPEEYGLRVPRAMEKPLEHATDLPSQLPPPEHGMLFLRAWGQALIPDEADYFERVVTFFLRTRFHVAPAPGELRRTLGAPQSPARIAALAMWGGKRDADGELFVEGEFPLDLRSQLMSESRDLMARARGDNLRGTEIPPAEARRAYETRVAEVLAEHKRDGAVYEFGEALVRTWAAFEGRVVEARTRRSVLDLVAFAVVLLASLRWGLRDAVSRWLAPLIGAAVILGWSQLAWWPIGTAVYVWCLQHFWFVLSGGLVLVAALLALFVQALRTMETPAVETL